MPYDYDPREYMRDLIRNVGDKAVRDIVNDFRNYNPHPAQDPSARVGSQAGSPPGASSCTHTTRW